MTAQMCDTLIVRGKKLDMEGDYIRPYLKRLRKNQRPEPRVGCTSLYRGFLGTWEIADGKLWLKDLHELTSGNDGPPTVSVMATKFHWLKPPVHATWISEHVYCSSGNMLQYVHHGWGSTYERSHIFLVNDGNILMEWMTLNPPPPAYYAIHPDGRRVRVPSLDAVNKTVLEDLFAPDEEPHPYRYWIKAAEHFAAHPEHPGWDPYEAALSYGKPRPPEEAITDAMVWRDPDHPGHS